MRFSKTSFILIYLLCHFATVFSQHEKNEISSVVSSYIDSAWYYKDKDLKKSLYYGNEALQAAVAQKQKREEARSLGTLGVILDSYGEYDKALHYHFSSLSILDSLSDSELTGICLNNIGNAFYHKNEYSKAIQYYKKSISYKNPVSNIQGIANTYGNIGLCYHKLKDYSNARKHFELALNINTKLNNITGIGINLNNIGNLFYSAMQYDSALFYYDKALKHFISAGNEVEISTIYKNIAQTYLNKDDVKQAEHYADKSLEIAEKQKSGHLLKEIYVIISKIKEKQKDYKASLNFFRKYEEIKDSLINAEKSRISMLSEAMFNMDKKQREVEKLQKENEIQRLQSNSLKWLLLLTICLGLLTIALVFIFYQKRIYNIKKKESELEQKLLRSQINSHFIFNVINSIQSSILNDDKMTAYRYNSKFAKLIRTILENSREKTVPLSNEIEALKNYMDIEQFRLENKFEYEVEVDNNIDIETQRIPAMLIQPFVENAIWHGIANIDGKGFIKISFTKNGHNLVISVTDNGIGRKKAAEKQTKLHKSMGIEVTEERLKLFNQKNSGNHNLVFEDLINEKGEISGTKVNIFISLKQIEKFNRI